MIAEPKVKLNKFYGMNGDGGMFNIDGFSIENENGISSIDENYVASEVVSSTTTNYSGTNFNVACLAYVYPLPGSSASEIYTLMMSSSSLFYNYSLFGGFYNGKIGGVPSSGSYLFCQKPDMFVLPSGNIIYTSSSHLGLGVRGLCKSSSSTTKIVDKDGRNFVTLGLSTSAPNNKVTNLVTGAEYTITSITTTDATNDTLNFTASGVLNNAQNNEFLALVNTKWDLLSGITIPTFKNQPSSVYWSRPIRQFNIGDIASYMILNGNYIAVLSNDESTIDTMYKQLPTGYQGLGMDINSGYVLISAVDMNGNSHLLYWDGYSDGWNEDTIISRAPNSVKNYGSGWVFLSDSTIYFTDGKNIQKLISHPDNKNLGQKLNTYSHNGICILDDVMYFAADGSNSNRTMDGVYVFNNKTGLSYFKVYGDGIGFITPYCIYVKNNSSISTIYSTDNDIEIGTSLSLCNLNDFNSSTNSKFSKSFVYEINLGEETKISQVWLNIQHTSKRRILGDSLSSNITVSTGNGKDGIIKYVQSSSVPSTTTVANTNGANYSISAGDELEFTSGDLAGQRTFVESVANKGTSSEIATVSPALTATYGSSSDIRLWKLKKGETKTITLSDLGKPTVFNVNFYGSVLYLEILIKGVSSSFPVSIKEILLF